MTRAGVRASRRSSRPASATTSACWSPRGPGISHHRFLDLPDLLEPGDLLVVNTSATLPAALESSGGLRVHLSTPLPRRRAPVARRRPRALGDRAARGRRAPPRRPRRAADRRSPAAARPSCWRPTSAASACGPRGCGCPRRCSTYLDRHGEPIRYRHQPEPRPLADYQTIFADRARQRRDAERRAAVQRARARGARGPRHHGRHRRAAHRRLVARARRARRTPSASASRPAPLRARARRAARDRRRHHRGAGARVGRRPASPEGWTRLVVEPERGVRVVDGILTGWHEPDASHLLMLEAIAGRRAGRALVRRGAGRRLPLARVRRLAPPTRGVCPPGHTPKGIAPRAIPR